MLNFKPLNVAIPLPAVAVAVPISEPRPVDEPAFETVITAEAAPPVVTRLPNWSSTWITG